MLDPQTQAIVAAVSDMITFNDRLWSMEDVARYLNRSYNTVMNRISKLPDFPPAIRLAGVHDKPLYSPKDVRKWAESKKEAH